MTVCRAGRAGGGDGRAVVQALGELDALMRELGAGDEADAQRQLLNERLAGEGMSGNCRRVGYKHNQ
ncbi:hypothetical protein KCP78_23325 [Salmonella enterica subsp. enterica]|nr:hypothetical protein KCP78_23325 [Salmonella enterica subsp. enterica]